MEKPYYAVIFTSIRTDGDNGYAKMVYTQPEIGVFWYLDEKFLRQTQNFHEIGISPSMGKHSITAIDALGNEVSFRISIE